MTKPGFINIGGKRIRAFFDDNKQPIEVYDEDIKSYIDYRSYIEKSNMVNIYDDLTQNFKQKSNRPSIKVLTTNKEGRNICGKVRTCKVSGGKILEVYDDDKKVYLPYDLFIKQQEEYKTNPIVDDTTEEYKQRKKEYHTTHGKKTRILENETDMKEDKKPYENKKPGDKVIPMNTATTILSTSGTGTSGITISDNIKVNVNIEEEKGEKRAINPYRRYINKVLRRK